MKTINIKTASGMVPAQAYMVANGRGLFAIHRAIRLNGTLGLSWAVTHIQSGLAVSNSIATLSEARRRARNFITFLNDGTDVHVNLWAAFETDSPRDHLPAGVMNALGRAQSMVNSHDSFLSSARTMLVGDLARIYFPNYAGTGVISLSGAQA